MGKELWEYFLDNKSISKAQYVDYIVSIITEDTKLKDILIIILNSKRGLYSREILAFRRDDISFSERTVTRDIKILHKLGLITIDEEFSISRAIIYRATPLGKDCLKKLREKNKGVSVK